VSKKELLNVLYSAASALKNEFVNSQFAGRYYRKKCCDERISRVFDAGKNRGVVDFVEVYKEPSQYFSNRIRDVVYNIQPFQAYQEKFVQDS